MKPTNATPTVNLWLSDQRTVRRTFEATHNNRNAPQPILFGKRARLAYVCSMLKFRMFGFPVAVDWWFWLTAVLLSGGLRASDAGDWAVVLARAAVIFVSIMVHELGHAFAGQRFGAQPGIKLHAFGGLTFLPGANFSRGQSIVVSGAGPLAGLALWLVLWGIDSQIGYLPPLAREALRVGLFVNLVWSLFNLLPIMPMDGGQILRELLGPTKTFVTAMIGGILAAALCVWSFTHGWVIMAVMLALMAYHNFRSEPVEGGVIKG